MQSEEPEALARVAIDPLTGIDASKAEEMAQESKSPEELIAKVVPVFQKLYEVYTSEDTTLVEVNPLRTHRRRRCHCARR